MASLEIAAPGAEGAPEAELAELAGPVLVGV